MPRAAAASAQRQRTGQAAGLVELDVDRVIACRRARPDRLPSWTDSSAQTGTGRVDPAPAPRHRPAGSGCSTSSTPEFGAGREHARQIRLGVQPSLASTISRPSARCGALRRSRSRSPSPPSFSLSRGRAARPPRPPPSLSRRVEAQRIGGDERLRLRQGPPAARPAVPRRLASRSHKAQSSALRRGAGRRRAPAPSRDRMPASMAGARRLERRHDAVDGFAIARHRARIRRGRHGAVLLERRRSPHRRRSCCRARW